VNIKKTEIVSQYLLKPGANGELGLNQFKYKEHDDDDDSIYKKTAVPGVNGGVRRWFKRSTSGKETTGYETTTTTLPPNPSYEGGSQGSYFISLLLQYSASRDFTILIYSFDFIFGYWKKFSPFHY
jgi:hypothetical protein